jgi:hypothetical protein
MVAGVPALPVLVALPAFVVGAIVPVVEQALRSVPAAAVQEERAGGTGLYVETASSFARAWSIWSYT